MRPLPLITAAFCAALFTANAAQATGNVLLPSSGNDTSSAPNLGIAPPPAPSTPQTVTSPPAAATTQAPAYTPTPAIMAAPQTSESAVNLNEILSPIDDQSAKNLPAGASPTRILHQTDNASALSQATANLPYALNISINGRSVFGSDDVAQISDKLGLSRDQIGAACYLSVSGLIQTDRGGGIVDGGLSPQITVRYDGIIQGSMLAAEALCTANKLPPGSGFINQLGNRYVITLQPISCAAPTRQVTQMVITYDGTEKSSCAYQ